MKVFKFGGASVNSADAVRNMAQIVRQHLAAAPLVVVVSAMGKTTNLLEKLVPGTQESAAEKQELRRQLEAYHRDITTALMPDNRAVQRKIDTLLADLDHLCSTLPNDAAHYNYNYDQTVSFGELLSTTIIAEYLNMLGINTLWADARQLIQTDNHYREGHVDWSATQSGTLDFQRSVPDSYQVILTQGFIAGTAQRSTLNSQFSTTTLGREGSDYSAAILAYCLDAESVTIWKDVPGFLNADPKYFSNTVKIEQIPYNEAIELAYYGASVIHPKTVKPLQNKSIQLHIRSFLDPAAKGSTVGDYPTIQPLTPLYIFKNKQILISIQPRDFSFIAEENLQTIFATLAALNIRVNMMQNTALSFSICIDDNAILLEQLTERLQHSFNVRYNLNLQLITIRYYTAEIIDDIVAGRTILLQQRTRSTAQLVVAG